MIRHIISRLSRRAILAMASLSLTALTAGAAEVTGWMTSGRIFPGERNVHTIWVGANDNYVIVDGDGDTDLDCWLYGPDGQRVSSDTDATDYCVLAAPGIGRHRVAIRNLGSVYNDYVIRTER